MERAHSQVVTGRVAAIFKGMYRLGSRRDHMLLVTKHTNQERFVHPEQQQHQHFIKSRQLQGVYIPTRK